MSKESRVGDYGQLVGRAVRKLKDGPPIKLEIQAWSGEAIIRVTVDGKTIERRWKRGDQENPGFYGSPKGDFYEDFPEDRFGPKLAEVLDSVNSELTELMNAAEYF